MRQTTHVAGTAAALTAFYVVALCCRFRCVLVKVDNTPAVAEVRGCNRFSVQVFVGRW